MIADIVANNFLPIITSREWEFINHKIEYLEQNL